MLPTPYERWRRLAWLAQEGSLYVLLVLLPFSKAAIEIAFGVLLGGWLLQRALPGGWRSSVWSRPAARLTLLALLSYVAACAVSILVSDAPSISLRGFIGKTLEYALFFVIVADVGPRSRPLRYGVALLGIGALLAGADGVAQELLGKDPIRHYRLDVYGRMYAPYQNPNDLATYCLLVIPVLLGHMMLAAWRWKWPLLGLLGFITGCMIRAGAQGAYVGLAVGVLVMGLCAWRGRRWALIAFAVSSVGIGAAAALHYRSSWFDVGFRDRLYMWQTAWQMFLDRPLLGHGVNTFMSNYLFYWVGGEHAPRYAHNCYLQTAAETGLLGLTAFLWLLGGMLWIVVRASRAAASAAHRWRLIGFCGSLAAFLVQAAVDTNFYSLRHVVFFWVLAGWAVGCAWSAQDTAAHPVAATTTADVA